MTPDQIIDEVLAHPGEWQTLTGISNTKVIRHTKEMNHFDGVCPLAFLCRIRGLEAFNTSWVTFEKALGLTYHQVNMMIGMADGAPWRSGYPVSPEEYARMKARLWSAIPETETCC